MSDELPSRIEYLIFLGRHEGWMDSRIADAVLLDPEIARLRKIANAATEYISNADYCLSSEDISIADEERRDAAESRLRASLGAQS